MLLCCLDHNNNTALLNTSTYLAPKYTLMSAIFILGKIDNHLSILRRQKITDVT